MPKKKKKQKKFLRKSIEEKKVSSKYLFLACLIIIVVAFGVYSNSFKNSFQFDDIHRIVRNKEIQDFSRIKPTLSGQRWVVRFTLALNYRLGKLNVVGYHIFNILFHSINGILVYFFVYMLLVKSDNREIIDPFFKKSDRKITKNNFQQIGIRNIYFSIPLFSALLFIVHPVQTESVTYIISRTEILATFFFLISVIFYMKANATRYPVRRFIFYLIVIISFLLGLESKEYVVILPFLLLLLDYFFFGPASFRLWIKRAKKFAIPIGILFFINVCFLVALSHTYKGETSAGFSVYNISHHSYLMTQFNVVIHYIKLLFIPANLNLDYDFPIRDSFWQYPTYLSFSILLALLIFAILIARKYKLFSFFILWFFITIAPSAGIIPIADVIFEHRLYLPSIGYCVILVLLINNLFSFRWMRQKLLSYKLTYAVLILLLVVYSTQTYLRNFVWRDEVTLWKDVIKKSPNKPRPHNNLGKIYLDKADELRDDPLAREKRERYLDMAREQFEKALKADPNFSKALGNLGIAYANKGEYKKAIETYYEAIIAYEEELKKEPKIRDEFAKVYHNLGVAYEYNDKGIRYGEGYDFKKAILAYQNAIGLNEDYADSYFNLGVIYYRQKDFPRAKKFFEKVLDINPNYPQAPELRIILMELREY